MQKTQKPSELPHPTFAPITVLRITTLHPSAIQEVLIINFYK
jgi:hypothetical protein